MLRLPLAVACVLLCVQSAFADLALTVKDIGLMLRSGYSSKVILADLATRHFAETLDVNHEAYLLDLHASPELIAALKSGQFSASLKEKLARVTIPIQQADEAKRMAQQGANRQAEEERQRTQRQSQSQIVVAPISGQTSEFLTPSEKAAKQRAEKIAEIAEIKDYWATHPQERAAQQAAEARAAQEKARQDEEAGHEEARQLKRKYERAIQSEGDQPASSIRVTGAMFPESDAARDVKRKYESAIRDAGDKPASSINVFVPFP